MVSFVRSCDVDSELVEEGIELATRNEAEPTGLSGSFMQAITHDGVLAVEQCSAHRR